MCVVCGYRVAERFPIDILFQFAASSIFRHQVKNEKHSGREAGQALHDPHSRVERYPGGRLVKAAGALDVRHPDSALCDDKRWSLWILAGAASHLKTNRLRDLAAPDENPGRTHCTRTDFHWHATWTLREMSSMQPRSGACRGHAQGSRANLLDQVNDGGSGTGPGTFYLSAR